MGDAHTCSVSGVHLIMTAIWLLDRELAHLAGEVVGSSRVHIPRRINGVGRSAAVIMTRHRGGSLLIIPFAIVALLGKSLAAARVLGLSVARDDALLIRRYS